MGQNDNKDRGKRKNTRRTSLFENDALRYSLLEALKTDDKVVVLASAQTTNRLPAYHNLLSQVVKEVAEKYSSRFFGLGEFLEDLVPTATQLLSEGLTPIALMGTSDLARSYAGLSAVCAASLPITFVLVSGAEEGQATQLAGVNELSVLLTLPQLNIAEPSDSNDLQQMLNTSLQSDSGPTILRYLPLNAFQKLHTLSATQLPGMGKGQMLRQGKSLALVALGPAVEVGMEIVNEFQKRGTEIALVGARWARPLDEALLGAVGNHFHRIVTLECGPLNGGFGATLLELFESKGWQNIKIHRMQLPCTPNYDLPQLVAEISQFVDKTNQNEGLKTTFSTIYGFS